MEEAKPVSVRLTEDQKERLRALGNGSIAKGIIYLLENHNENPSKINGLHENLEKIRSMIDRMKSSPIGYDKKKVAALEEKYAEASKLLKIKELKEVDNEIEHILTLIS